MQIIYWLFWIVLIILSSIIGSICGAIFGLFIGPAQLLAWLSDSESSNKSDII